MCQIWHKVAQISAICKVHFRTAELVGDVTILLSQHSLAVLRRIGAFLTMVNKAVVLIVDDEPILRMSGAAMVEDAGFEPIEASHADEAIQILESRNDVRLLLTDIDMPNGSLNGLKLAAAVRRRWPPIAIIIVSGHQVPTGEELPEGSTFYAKPYPEAVVIAKMQSLLRAA
ncbi:MAG: response regulator [Pseudomonadota bacterium]